MEEVIQWMMMAKESYTDLAISLLRYIAPALAFVLLWRCLKPLLLFKREPEIWAWLHLADGTKHALTHWENVIGRSKSSDVRIDFPTVSRNHAVLTRYDDGSWTVTDANSKGGVWVNGQQVKICALEEDDVINIGGMDMTLAPITKRQESLQAQLRTKGASGFDSVANLLLLTIFQCICCIGLLLGGKPEHFATIIQGFGGIFAAQWALFIFYAIIRRSAFEVETVAFFLCTMGMAALASIKPAETGKQLFAMFLGILVFLIVGWSMRDLERAKKFRYLAVILGIGIYAAFRHRNLWRESMGCHRRHDLAAFRTE